MVTMRKITQKIARIAPLLKASMVLFRVEQHTAYIQPVTKHDGYTLKPMKPQVDGVRPMVHRSISRSSVPKCKLNKGTTD